jgi:hypothetical protein
LAIKFNIDKDLNITRRMEPEEIVAAGVASGLFPLYTKKDLAERWGESIQVVNNWSNRHKDFPKALSGILAKEPEGKRMGGGAGVGGLYPLYEVERYEQARGMKP